MPYSKPCIAEFVVASATFLYLISIAPSPACAQVRFNRDIRPILSRHCTACHGPDESAREADLRIDTFEGATDNAIEPGDPDNSLLIERVVSDDDPMPPEGHGDRLTTEEITKLRQWIEEGAKYETHWAFVKPVAPSLPVLDVRGTDHPIDLFVRKKALIQLGSDIGPSADPARLIRRLSLDLTGLPPRREWVDRFVNNPNDSEYESIVDQLLSEPTYGEHWASMWLDLARYADTMGYAGDENRTIWPWRDWLIEALNENEPFDQFSIDMLAGDLRRNASEQQRLATAFHRNTLNNSEGGTNDEEFRTIAVKDRLSTTLNTWMGLTVRCAECHSHKYDPINHHEYYELLAFFNQTEDQDRADDYPTLVVRPDSLDDKLAAIDAQVADLLSQQMERETSIWTTLLAKSWETEGTRLEKQPDGSLLASGANPAAEVYSIQFQVPESKITGLRIEVQPSQYHGGNTGRGENGAFVMTLAHLEARSANELKSVVVKFNDAAADYSQRGFEAKHLFGRTVKTIDEPLGWAVGHPSQGYGIPRSVVLQFEKPLDPNEVSNLNLVLMFTSKWHHSNAGQIRVSWTGVDKPADKFRKNQLDGIENRINQLTKQRNQPIKIPVLAELPMGSQRETHLMKRGNFQNIGDLVNASTPRAFHEFPDTLPNDRMGLARWIFDSNNPLTARVTVNRLWARLFGKGIVVTEEDFGTQGSPPTHPELLDWLALDLQRDWDVKRTLKQMVMSRTYRQSGKASSKQIETDPRNQFITRGPRNRLPAETIRDQALAVSGLLSNKMYGPPVYPPNPIKQVTNAFKGADVWKTSTGADRYRRSLYTFLKRSQPHPLFETFDTATRDVCSLRRINTNTPLQSFMTLNDETFVEASQALALRMLKHDPDIQKQISHGLELAVLRPADSLTVKTLADLYDATLADYQQDAEKAKAMIGNFGKNIANEQQARLAALAVVANVILNLDEFLTR